ncbi:hypothetical protein CHU98_g741 [Xylaria longipes]|nr:hypothetical protein CHU98_g741 [Xylaria longipes]
MVPSSNPPYVRYTCSSKQQAGWCPWAKDKRTGLTNLARVTPRKRHASEGPLRRKPTSSVPPRVCRVDVARATHVNTPSENHSSKSGLESYIRVRQGPPELENATFHCRSRQTTYLDKYLVYVGRYITHHDGLRPILTGDCDDSDKALIIKLSERHSTQRSAIPIAWLMDLATSAWGTEGVQNDRLSQLTASYPNLSMSNSRVTAQCSRVTVTKVAQSHDCDRKIDNSVFSSAALFSPALTHDLGENSLARIKEVPTTVGVASQILAPDRERIQPLLEVLRETSEVTAMLTQGDCKTGCTPKRNQGSETKRKNKNGASYLGVKRRSGAGSWS